MRFRVFVFFSFLVSKTLFGAILEDFGSQNQPKNGPRIMEKSRSKFGGIFGSILRENGPKTGPKTFEPQCASIGSLSTPYYIISQEGNPATSRRLKALSVIRAKRPAYTTFGSLTESAFRRLEVAGFPSWYII